MTQRSRNRVVKSKLHLQVESLEDRLVPAGSASMALLNQGHLLAPQPSLAPSHLGQTTAVVSSNILHPLTVSPQGGTKPLDGKGAPKPDSEGYTRDTPAGLTLQQTNWDDFQNNWNNGGNGRQDITKLVQLGIENELHKDKNYDASKDPFANGMDHVLQQLVSINYKDQVTGDNLAALSDKIQKNLRDQIKSNLGDIANTDTAWGYSLSLSTDGDFSAQLASQDSSGKFLSNPTSGDVILLKYVTHGNYVKFTVGLNFGGQLLDPFYIFSGGPSFTVTFDTVTTVALKLPHRSGQGMQILSATVHASGSELHAENADAFVVKSMNFVIQHSGANQLVGDFFAPAQRAFDNLQLDLKDKVQGKLQQANTLFVGQAKFDQADYHVDWNTGTVVMNFTENPWRQVQVNINDLQENFHATPEQGGMVHTFAKVQIGAGQKPAEYDGLPIYRYYPDGTRMVTVHVEIWRQITPKTIHGHIVEENGKWYIKYDDGTSAYLPNFNQDDPRPRIIDKLVAPPVRGGLVETIDLQVDYAFQSVTGIVGTTVISAKAGDKIHIPGDSSLPDVWLTINLEGTRNGQPGPNDHPPDLSKAKTQTRVRGWDSVSGNAGLFVGDAFGPNHRDMLAVSGQQAVEDAYFAALSRSATAGAVKQSTNASGVSAAIVAKAFTTGAGDRAVSDALAGHLEDPGSFSPH
jgi:hypothetical protein